MRGETEIVISPGRGSGRIWRINTDKDIKPSCRTAFRKEHCSPAGNPENRGSL